MSKLDEVIARAKAVMEMTEQAGVGFGPFPPKEALDFAWAVQQLAPRPEAADREAIISAFEDEIRAAGGFHDEYQDLNIETVFRRLREKRHRPQNEPLTKEK